MKTIMFTGGGTAGHIMPNIALIDELKSDYRCVYIGSGGTEEGLIAQTYPDGSVPFHRISARKFKRKLSLSNLLLPFSFIKSVRQAKKILKKIKPSLIFSKGGFVSLPVVVAGHMKRIPVVVHESDLSLGLANKLSKPFCKKLLTTFPETAKKAGKKASALGSPLRQEVLSCDRQKGLAVTGFDGQRKIVTVVGGSAGAARLNKILYDSLDELTKELDVFLISGKGKLDRRFDRPHFQQREFVSDIFDVFAASDVIISRAGSNTVCEICQMKKALLLVPLSQATRGEQLQNARYFAEKNCALSLDEETLTGEVLRSKIFYALRHADVFKNNQEKLQLYGTQRIAEYLRSLLQ